MLALRLKGARITIEQGSYYDWAGLVLRQILKGITAEYEGRLGDLGGVCYFVSVSLFH